MARMIHCIKLNKEAEGLDFAPMPGDLGKKLWQEVSKEAWAGWLKHQTMLINENRLNMADTRARQYLLKQVEKLQFVTGTGAKLEMSAPFARLKQIANGGGKD